VALARELGANHESSRRHLLTGKDRCGHADASLQATLPGASRRPPVRYRSRAL